MKIKLFILLLIAILLACGDDPNYLSNPTPVPERHIEVEGAEWPFTVKVDDDN